MILPKITSEKKCLVEYCTFYATETYLVLKGDEHFYQFVGKVSNICFTDNVHPDYLDEFTKTFSSLGPNEEKRLITMLKAYDENYYVADMTLKNEELSLNNNPVISISAYFISAMENVYISMLDNLTKYRNYLALFHRYLIDYDMETEIITMYFYVGTQANPVFRSNINDLYDKIMPYYTSAELKTEFEILYHNLRDANGNFSCKCNLPVNHEFSKLRRFDIDGNILSKENDKKVVICILYPEDKDAEVIPYYATQEAIDPLTKLLNKRAASEYTMTKLNSGLTYNQYMIIFDVDNFKSINDTYGHLFGDEVLAKIGSAITKLLANRGIAGRFGGDEFFIFTKDIEDEASLRMFLTALRREIKFAFEGEIENFYVTLSLGVCAFPKDGKTYDELFKKADKCLYIAKEKGKDRFIIYDEEKHGSLDTNEKLKHRALKPSEQAEALAIELADITQNLYANGIVGIGSVLDFIQSKIEVDGCRVYRNSDPNPIFEHGNSNGSPDMEGILDDPIFLKQFNSNHVLMIAGTPTYEATHKKFSLSTQACNIMACVCAYYDQPNGDRIFVFFDIYNHTIRWEESTKNYLAMIGKIIANLF